MRNEKKKEKSHTIVFDEQTLLLDHLRGSGLHRKIVERARMKAADTKGFNRVLEVRWDSIISPEAVAVLNRCQRSGTRGEVCNLKNPNFIRDWKPYFE